MHLLLLFGIEEKQTQFPKGLKAAHFHSARFFAAFALFGVWPSLRQEICCFPFPLQTRSTTSQKRGLLSTLLSVVVFAQTSVIQLLTLLVPQSHKKWDQNMVHYKARNHRDMTAEFYRQKPNNGKVARPS